MSIFSKLTILVALVSGVLGVSCATSSSDHLLLRGQALTSDGQPLRGITVFSHLNMPLDLRTKSPAEVSLPMIGAPSTSDSGEFTLTLDPAEVPESYFDPGGEINITVWLAGGEEGVYRVDSIRRLNFHPPLDGEGPWRADVDEDTRNIPDGPGPWRADTAELAEGESPDPVELPDDDVIGSMALEFFVESGELGGRDVPVSCSLEPDGNGQQPDDDVLAGLCR